MYDRKALNDNITIVDDIAFSVGSTFRTIANQHFDLLLKLVTVINFSKHSLSNKAL